MLLKSNTRLFFVFICNQSFVSQIKNEYFCLNYKSNEKMDIGDIGFLLIAFIIYLVNLFMKVNKEKIEKQRKAEDTNIPDIPELEPWDEEYPMPPFFDIPSIPKKPLEVVEKTPKSSIPSSYSFEYDEEKMKPIEGAMSSMSDSLFKEDNMESVSYQDEETEGDVSYTNELFHGNITEELKKGIIYSEILHRKYE